MSDRRLSKAAFEQARTWLAAHARPLDRAMFALHFAGGNAAAMIEELRAYRNNDGGFGHGLEPDVTLDQSCVVATTAGLQALRAGQADASHPLVRGAIAYLLENLDRETLAWVNVPANVSDAPHAPWWTYRGRPTGFTANPGAEIVGHFHHWASLVPADLLARLTDAAMNHLRHLTAERMHDVLCYESLRQTQELPAAIRAEVLRLCRPLVEQIVETDLAKWTSYVTRPLDVVDSPDSPYFELFREPVGVNLDYLIETQRPDGAWPVYWGSWNAKDDRTSRAWERSCRAWQGFMVVKNLQRLQVFGRINVA